MNENQSNRFAEVGRQTAETQIVASLNLDVAGSSEFATGIPFLDHMLHTLARHWGVQMRLRCIGDLAVDDHHTVEDCALAIGQALDQCLGERRGIRRFGYAYAPLDDSLVRSVVDFSGRGGAWIHLTFPRERLGQLSCENIPHFFRSLAIAARLTAHIDLIRGENAHHIAEAAFKSLALSLRAATELVSQDVPSTKGSL